jgi:hypothetical protein
LLFGKLLGTGRLDPATPLKGRPYHRATSNLDASALVEHDTKEPGPPAKGSPGSTMFRWWALQELPGENHPQSNRLILQPFSLGASPVAPLKEPWTVPYRVPVVIESLQDAILRLQVKGSLEGAVGSPCPWNARGKEYRMKRTEPMAPPAMVIGMGLPLLPRGKLNPYGSLLLLLLYHDVATLQFDGIS